MDPAILINWVGSAEWAGAFFPGHRVHSKNPVGHADVNQSTQISAIHRFLILREYHVYQCNVRIDLDAFPEHSTCATFLFDEDKRVLYANRVAVALAKKLDPGGSDRELTYVYDWHPEILPVEAMRMCATHGEWIGEVLLKLTSQRQLNLTVQISMLGPGNTWPCGLRVRDITADRTHETELYARNAELEIAYAKLKGAQEQAVQSEKLASIGQLSAGVAHEINNPMGYINSNLSTLQRYVTNLLKVVEISSNAKSFKT